VNGVFFEKFCFTIVVETNIFFEKILLSSQGKGVGNQCRLVKKITTCSSKKDALKNNG